MKTFVGLAAGVFVAVAAWAVGSSLQAQTASQMPHPGAAIYRLRCAACHEAPAETKSPSRTTLSAMSYQVLSFALTNRD